MATLTGSGVNFSDGTTINGTTFNSIGSYCAGSRTGASLLTSVNTTAAGSSILQAVNSYSAFEGYSSIVPLSNLGRAGTWRAMSSVLNTSTDKNGNHNAGAVLWVRIS